MTGALLQRGILFGLLWWIAVEGRQDAWGMGLVAATTATGVSLVMLPPGKNSVSPGGLFGFLGFFVWQSVKGGVQVAAIALRGRLDLRPTVIELPLVLPPGLPRVLLACVLGLMPGTVGICLSNDRLRLHVLDERLPVTTVVRAMEAHIARMFGSKGAA